MSRQDLLDRQPRFPLGEAVLIEAAQPLSTAALIATCSALVLAGQGLDPEGNIHVRAVMNALLFAYLPVGLFSVLLSIAVKSKPELVGVTSGLLLVHFLLPTVLGGVVNIVKSGEDAWIVAVVTGILVVATVGIWSCICSYPKFLRCGRGD